jgi:hypothetical protein
LRPYTAAPTKALAGDGTALRTEMVQRFKGKCGIERMAAGHCTGQFAFAGL